jgi:hypothetical protein
MKWEARKIHRLGENILALRNPALLLRKISCQY